MKFCREHPDASNAIKEWYHELLKAEFKNFNDLKKTYGEASIVGDDKVIFNIKGNKYRLVVRLVFEYKTIQVKWFGTHAEYDKINASKIQFKRK